MAVIIGSSSLAVGFCVKPKIESKLNRKKTNPWALFCHRNDILLVVFNLLVCDF